MKLSPKAYWGGGIGGTMSTLQLGFHLGPKIFPMFKFTRLKMTLMVLKKKNGHDSGISYTP